MPYWIVFKKGQYVSGTDENGYPLHTENKDDAWKFYDFDVAILPATFFAHFKVIEGREKMCYSDFEYILCNYVFTDAVLFPEEYSGVHHLIIQGWGGATIMINVNKEENVIRVSYNDTQEKYMNYEEALEGIRKHGCK